MSRGLTRLLPLVVLAWPIAGCSDTGDAVAPDGSVDTVGSVDVASDVSRDEAAPPDDALVPLGEALPRPFGPGCTLAAGHGRAAVCCDGSLSLFHVDGGLWPVEVPSTGCDTVALPDGRLVVAEAQDLTAGDWLAGASPGTLASIATLTGIATSASASGQRACVTTHDGLVIVEGDGVLEVPLDDAPTACVPHQTGAWVAAGSDLRRLDAAGALVASAPLAGAPASLAVGAQTLWAASGPAGLEPFTMGEEGLTAASADDLGGLPLSVAAGPDDVLAVALYEHVGLFDVDGALLGSRASERRTRDVLDPLSGLARAEPALAVAWSETTLVVAWRDHLQALAFTPSVASPDLRPDRRVIALPDGVPGELVAFSVVVRNHGDAPGTLEPPPAAVGPFSFTGLEGGPWELAPGGAHALEGAWLADDGWHDETVSLETSDPDEPLLDVRLIAGWPTVGEAETAPPDVDSPRGDGLARSLADLDGKVVLLKFFNFL